jgi:DNA-nicking Smr family endonuclease
MAGEAEKAGRVEAVSRADAGALDPADSPRRRRWNREENVSVETRGLARGASVPMSEPHRIPIEDTIDLHAFHPRDVVSVVDEYVRAASAAGLRHVRLIHGRGTGVQRGIVQAALERHPLVEAFADAPDAHLGATTAVLTTGVTP